MNKQNKWAQKEIDSMKTVKDNRAQKKWKKLKKTKKFIYIKGIFSVQLYTHVVPIGNRKFSGFVLPVRWDLHCLLQILDIINVKYTWFL